MAFKIIVLAKQVPDTRNVGNDAMKADGTVNRSALPAIFNPDDLNALEQALQIKEKNPGSEIIILTMGPPRAADIIRESLYRNADKGYLITDRRFAGADTLATSYVISKAIEKIAPYDIILSGRQAIDGDTAQVGPQTAEKLNIPQITYAEEITSITKDKITVKRRLERGVEEVECTLPVLLTVHGSAKSCRPKNVKLFMKYKHAKTHTELQTLDDDYLGQEIKNKAFLNIEEISLDDLDCDLVKIGLAGSPTKVKTIQNVVHTAKDSMRLEDNDNDIKNLMGELINNHTLG
ncbi:MAG: electron transfer flavoprotein subunit beta/FixA family protein [Candidatus Delongbacteria bacterium]|jgi:electron transfer flavoprotein beta subunit|nr:electron transfer flavoprotein subunit beta/FixA family protein [Candidatus Delongbacteria bacterium]